MDPASSYIAGMSPYQSMMNNPITFNDPEGDIAPLVWAAIAVGGGALNVWRNWDHIQNGGGWGAGLKAFGVGATAAVVGTIAAPAAGVGATFGATVGSFATAGAVGGAVGGAIEGFGNSLFFSDGDFFDHLGQGITHGVIGGIGGAVVGAGIGAGAHWLAGLKAPSGTTPATTGTADDVFPEFIDNQSVYSKGGHHLRGESITQGIDLDEYVVSATRPGTFNVSNWANYPAGLPRPTGPFRLLQGAEYNAARNAASRANQAMSRANPELYQGMEIHEIHPVKFGGSPTDPANKIILPRGYHRKVVTPWWNRYMRSIKKIP